MIVRYRVLIVLALVLCAAPAFAQTGTPADNCIPGVPPYQVTSGRPPTIPWLQDPTTADANGVQVPYFIDGFSYSLDGGSKTDMSPKPVAQTSFTCPATSPNAGKIPYGFTLPAGVAKGNHSIIVCTWNFTRDASGNPTSQRQEVCAAAVPFVAIDATFTGPPPAPKNIKVIR